MKHIKRIFENNNKSLMVSVYKDSNGGDSTNDGISSKYNDLYLIGEGVSGPSESKDEQTVKLVKRNFPWGDYIHVEPLIQPEKGKSPMFGGNFIYSSDSRFPSKYPIPIHDRFEF